MSLDKCSLKQGTVQASGTFAGAIPAGEMSRDRKFRKVSLVQDTGILLEVRGNRGIAAS